MQIITNKPEKANVFEQRIANYFLNEDPDGETLEFVRSVLVDADYITDCPGYAGPVYVVLFGGAPEFHLILIERYDENREFSYLQPIEKGY